MSRLLAAAALTFLLVRPAAADAPNPFDLVQGLREHGMSDLAIEYLGELEKANPSADMKVVIPLELAKTNLLLAQQETDESIRDAAIANAKQQFQLFLLNHGKHPRAAEAKMALARVLSVQAKAALNRAARIDITGADGRVDDGKKKEKVAAYAAIRPLFRDATKEFGDAAKLMKALIDNPMTDPYRKRSLTREALQAEMDRGVNQFSLAETYLTREGKDAEEHAAAIKEAKKIFTDLGKEDPNNPICWAARAWVGACELEIQDNNKAKEAFAAIRSEWSRNPGPGADGVRMVEFFEAQNDYLNARGGADLGPIRQARVKTKNWLDKDKYKARMTPERLSVTYYYAYLTQREAEADTGNQYEKKAADDPGPRRLLSVTNNARSLLQEAAREYKKLLDFDNDYTDRAERQRLRAIRFIVGNATKPAAQYTNFDECLMAAQVRFWGLPDALAAIDRQLQKEMGGPADAADEKAEEKKPEPKKDDKKPEPPKPAGAPAKAAPAPAPVPMDGKTPEQRAAERKEKELREVLALFERARDLITPATPPKDAAEAKWWLARAYLRCDRPQAAAIAAEDVAKSNRGLIAARAAELAIAAYETARKAVDPADFDAKAVDLARAVSLGAAIDKTNSNDPSTDRVRMQLARFYNEEKQYRDAYDVLSKIGVGFANVADARMMQGRAAFRLYVDKDSKLTPDERAALLNRAITAAEGVPEPTNPAGLRSFFTMRNVLAQLCLLQGGPSLAKADGIAANTAARAAASPLPPADKKAVKFAAEEIRLRSLYIRVVPLFKEMKYKELGEKMDPTLLELKKAGPAAPEVEAYRGKEPDALDGDTGAAVEAADSLDKYRREVIVLAMQGRIREGAFDQAADLFKLLEQLGGSVEATTDALAKLVAQVRPQIDDLKKAMKAEEANQLTAVVGKLLIDQSAKDKLAARPRAALGRSLRDLGLYDKALEVLAKVPAVDAETLKKPLSDLDADKRDAVIAYQVAQIEQVRAYRLTKQYDKADELLAPAVGPDGKGGWAKSLEFRKERVYVIEDRAADAEAAKKRELWGKAVTGWGEVAKPYIGAVRAPIPKDQDRARVLQDREKLYPVILDIFVDERRCLARANSQLIATPAKLTDSLNGIGKAIAGLEKGYAKGLTPEVRQRYFDLLNEFPAVKDGYKTAGGVAYLDPTAELPAAEEKK